MGGKLLEIWHLISWNLLGLVLFVTTTISMILILIFDAWLDANNFTTISQYCREQPWLAFLILSAIEIGVMGLAIHLMAFVPIAKV